MSVKKRTRLLSDSDSDDQVATNGLENRLEDEEEESIAEHNVYTSPTAKKMAELGDADEESDEDITIRRRAQTSSGAATSSATSKRESRPVDLDDAERDGYGGVSDYENENDVTIARRREREVEGSPNANQEEDYEEIFAGDNDDLEAVDINMGAEELLNADQQQAGVEVKKKRAIKKRNTLNAKLFIDKDKGLLDLNRRCRKIKFKGKGYEEQDFDSLLWNIEHWAHMLCPAAKFKDFLEHAERLGKKIEIKNFLRSVRSGELEYGLPEMVDSDNENVKPSKKQDLDFDDVLMEEENLIREMETIQENSFANDSEVGRNNKNSFSNYGPQNNTMNTTSVNGFNASKLVTSTPYPKHLLTNKEQPSATQNKSPLSDDIARKIEEKRLQALAKRVQRASMPPPLTEPNHHAQIEESPIAMN